MPALSKKGTKGGIWAWVIWAVASLFYLYEYFLRVAPSVMIRELMVHFQITAGAFGTLVAFYFWAYAPLQPLVGVLLDRMGGKKVLPGAVLSCMVGAYLFGWTHHYWVAALGRLMMGAGSAFAFVGAMYVATNWFPPRKIGLLAGLTTTLGMLGAVAGQGPTAWISKTAGWKMAWFGAAIFGLCLAVVISLIVPKRPPWAETEAGPGLWKNLGRVFRNRQTWIVGLFAGMIYVPTSVFAALWGVPFLETAYGLDRITAGTAISMIFVGWIVGAPLAGWISDRLGKRKPPMVFSSILVFLFTVVLIYFPVLPLGGVFTVLLFIGISSGGQALCFAAGFEANPRSARGTSLGVINMLVMATAPIFQTLVGVLLDHVHGPKRIVGTAHFTLADYHLALMVVPLSALFSLVFALLVRETFAKAPTG